MPGVQDQAEGTDVRVDVQPEDSAKAVQMDFGRCGDIAQCVVRVRVSNDHSVKYDCAVQAKIPSAIKK